MLVSMPTKISHVDGSQLAGLRKMRRESVGALTCGQKLVLSLVIEHSLVGNLRNTWLYTIIEILGIIKNNHCTWSWSLVTLNSPVNYK